MFKVIECEKHMYTIKAELDWNHAFETNQKNYRKTFSSFHSTISDLLTYKQFIKFQENETFKMDLKTFKKITKSQRLIQLYAAFLHGRAEYRRNQFKVA